MKKVFTAMSFAAGLAAFGAQAGADELRVPASLVSFGAERSLVPHADSAAGLVLGPAAAFSPNIYSGSATVLPVAFGGAGLPDGYAASQALNIHVALDSGYNLDLGQRFENYGASVSPLLDQGNYLSLANGGQYGGITYAPMPDLRLRLGVEFRNNRTDGQDFNPAPMVTGLPAPFNNGQQHSLLAGASWDLSNWAGLNLSGILASQKGQPAGFDAAGLTPSTTATTGALNVSAHVNLGGGWVTSASFSGGTTQLDQKSGDSASIDSQSYSIAIAKQGLFGGDAVGVSLSRPSPSMMGDNFTMAAAGDVPPVAVAGRLPGGAPETDLQLGYVTSFLNGALALQANAAYQMNYQGQTGATSLAVLSRAKIKF
jgi:hypothetical protein